MNAAPPVPFVPASGVGPSRWTFERKLGLSYAAATALVLLMVALCSWQGERFVRFNQRVEHQQEVIDTIEKVVELVTDAETNQRGYWILGDPIMHDQSLINMEAMSVHLHRLGELTVDNVEQSGRLRELTNAVREKLARIRKNLEARRQQELPALLASGYVTGTGQQLRLRVRAAATEMITVEQRFLQDHMARRSVSLHAVVCSVAGLGGLLGLLLGVIYKLGDAELRARRRLSRELVVARDEALEAVRQKSEFLANMSHEIRTPLNGIVGMAGLLRERPLDLEALDCAGTIDTCAEALLSVINDVLDFSKIEAGRLSFAHAPFDLRETLDETLTILGARATAKGLGLNVLVSSGVPAGLVGDAGRLRQVLLNLLGNAVKFTEHGEVILGIATATQPRPGTAADGVVTLRFEVRDTGIGIAPDGRGRLFQAFSQIDGSHTRRFGGTGLGLAISKELVAGMGGDIGVESVPGVGSTFWFTARFTVDPALTGILASALPPAAATLLAGQRVLMVGEASGDRRHVQRMLTDWGLFHQSADDGHRGLAMLRLAAASGRPFHVALIDVDLAGLAGPALAAEIRGDPEVANTRLVLLSDTRPGESAALPPEFDARLARPVRSRLLLDTLRRLAATPLADQAAAVLAPTGVVPVIVPPEPVGGPKPRVLLAEDNLVNRKVALRQLHNLGCLASTVCDGGELLARLADGERYDLILMDVQMPEMDGYETTRELRARFWPSGVGPPVVAMTANALEGDREKCLAAGMDDYLPKPVKQDALEAVLRRWLPPRVNLADERPRDRQAVSVD